VSAAKPPTIIARVVALLTTAGPSLARDLATALDLPISAVQQALHEGGRIGTVARAGRRGRDMVWRIAVPGDVPRPAAGARVSLRLDGDSVREVESEAKRLGRSASWVIQKAWQIAKRQQKALPGA
jgi:uncharacterized small protein (TIGR04563 family)